MSRGTDLSRLGTVAEVNRELARIQRRITVKERAIAGTLRECVDGGEGVMSAVRSGASSVLRTGATMLLGGRKQTGVMAGLRIGVRIIKSLLGS